eukprot:gene68-541_t
MERGLKGKVIGKDMGNDRFWFGKWLVHIDETQNLTTGFRKHCEKLRQGLSGSHYGKYQFSVEEDEFQFDVEDEKFQKI